MRATHTHTHTHTHTYAHTYAHIYTHTFTHTHAWTARKGERDGYLTHHYCVVQASVASLLGPALPLFSNLRSLTAHWAGDGLNRTHLNGLQHASLLQQLIVTYSGTVDLGPCFPQGEAQFDDPRRRLMLVYAHLFSTIVCTRASSTS
jgi:hypothetical protein